MPLIISHGLGKSGSSFLFQAAASAAARANGSKNLVRFARETFPESAKITHYAAEPTDEVIDTIERHLPGDKYYVLKTHGRLTPRIAARIQDGTLKTFTSFRDPRDCSIAMFDAGARDRAVSKNSFFATLADLPATFKHVKFGWSVTREWAGCEQTLKIPYYLTAADQNKAIQLVCNHIDLGKFADAVQQEFANPDSTKVWEFNKGVADRFLDAMSTYDLIWSSGYFMDEFEEVDALTEKWMTEYGYRDAYEVMHRRREKRMQAIWASVQG
jgi:hypothetical protein